MLTVTTAVDCGEDGFMLLTREGKNQIVATSARRTRKPVRRIFAIECRFRGLYESYAFSMFNLKVSLWHCAYLYFRGIDRSLRANTCCFEFDSKVWAVTGNLPSALPIPALHSLLGDNFVQVSNAGHAELKVLSVSKSAMLEPSWVENFCVSRKCDLAVNIPSAMNYLLIAFLTCSVFMSDDSLRTVQQSPIWYLACCKEFCLAGWFCVRVLSLMVCSGSFFAQIYVLRRISPMIACRYLSCDSTSSRSKTRNKVKICRTKPRSQTWISLVN